MIDRRRRRVVVGGAATATVAWLAPWSIEAAAFGYPRLLEGPMVGAVGPTDARVWGRASGPYPLTVQFSPDRDFANPLLTTAVSTSAAGDFAGVVSITGLTPATEYFYRVLVDGVVDRYRPTPFRLRTAPAGAASFRVAFGSCARYERDPIQRVFDGVVRQSPDVFIWLGDNVYADTEAPEAIAQEYRRQRGVNSLLPLLRSVPQLAIWDDHDFGYNNSDGTSPFRSQSLDVFRRYWANPAYGLPDAPGVFFQYTYGGIDFFMLDGRYYRSPNGAVDGAEKTFLGAGQLAWLKAALLASRSPFKILACGSGWSMADGEKGDTWAAFRTERDALFDFIRDRKIEGVVCLSGDSHVGELNCIPWSERGGYDIYDLVSSPLAQGTSDSWVNQRPEIRMRKVHMADANFGLLEFTHAPTPTLKFSLYDENGNSVWAPLTLTPSDLKNGVSSWRKQISPAELERYERLRAESAGST